MVRWLLGLDFLVRAEPFLQQDPAPLRVAHDRGLRRVHRPKGCDSGNGAQRHVGHLRGGAGAALRPAELVDPEARRKERGNPGVCPTGPAESPTVLDERPSDRHGQCAPASRALPGFEGRSLAP